MSQDENEDDGYASSVLDGLGDDMEQDQAEDNDHNQEEDDTPVTHVDKQQQQAPSQTRSETSASSSGGHSHTSKNNKNISREDLPPRVINDSPKDGRQSLNIYITAEDKQRMRELQGIAEKEFDENVHMIDVYLASLRADFYNDQSFISEMEKIGYGF